MRSLHPYLLSFQATVSRQYISSLVLFQVLVCDLCVLCLSLRQRGDWGRQCRGQSERSIPAHYWQSADAFRTVAQAGAACVRALENASQKTQRKHVARLQDHRTSRGAHWIVRCLMFCISETFKRSRLLWKRFNTSNEDLPNWAEKRL